MVIINNKNFSFTCDVFTTHDGYVASRDSSVSIATGYGSDNRMIGVRYPEGAGNFFPFHHRVQTGSGVHPASYQMGTGVLSLGIKRPGREADHSSLSSAKVKNAWSYTSTPPMRFHGVVFN
jgi:hypothetical protein